MRKTINLFNLLPESHLPNDKISSISARPSNLDKNIEKILQALASGFKKSLHKSIPVKIDCVFESNFSPRDNRLRYGVSLIIDEWELIPKLKKDELENLCLDQANRIIKLSSYLLELRSLDGDLPGKIDSGRFFKERRLIDPKFALETDVNWASAIRKKKVDKDYEIELKLNDETKVLLNIPQNYSEPRRQKTEEIVSFEIRALNHDSLLSDAFVNDKDKITKIEYPPELIYDINEAFFKKLKIMASITPIHSHCDGKVVIDRLYVNKILGKDETQDNLPF